MLSEKPWKVDWIVLMGAALMLSWSLGILLGHWLQPKSPNDPAFHQFLLTAISFHGFALVLTHQFLKQHEVGWKEFLGLTNPRLGRALLIASLAAIVLVPAALRLNEGCHWLLEHAKVEATEQRTVKILRVSVGWGRQIGFGIGTILLAPLAEEILFRGILYPFLRPRLRPWLAALITALAFGAFHTNLLTFIPLAFLGLAFVGLYELTDTLLAPIVAHALFNAVNFAYMLLQMKGTG